VLATEMLEALGVETSKTFSLIETGEALERNDEPLADPLGGAGPARATAISGSAPSSGSPFSTRPTISGALTDYCLRHYSTTTRSGAARTRRRGCSPRRRGAARLAASYIAAGFVHGVLNSDNIAITAESFDYGPVALDALLGRPFHRGLFRPCGPLRVRPPARGDPLGPVQLARRSARSPPAER
jgi:uncharacterized protein YdiU (UPF0061 family)